MMDRCRAVQHNIRMSAPRISLVVPSNRTAAATIGRLLEWSDYDPARFELVVRDNSNDPRKREILERAAGPALRLHCVASCDAVTNFIEAMRLATGDVRLWCSDDDRLFPHGLDALSRALSGHVPLVQGARLVAFGAYFIEDSRASRVFRYPPLAGCSLQERLTRFTATSSDVPKLFYSALSGRLADQVVDFMTSLPCQLSFVDQTASLFYLLAGDVVQVDQVFHGYCMDHWDNPGTAMKQDRLYYEVAGFDTGMDILHFLLIAMEGFMLLRSRLARSLTGQDLESCAAAWFLKHFAAFRAIDRSAGLSGRTADRATALRRSLIRERRIDSMAMLDSVAEVMAISNAPVAVRYREFWRTL